MTTGHVIDFSPMGEATAMHNDKFDLSFLGAQSITRASEIKFNESRQKWRIELPASNILGSDPFYPVFGGEGFDTYDGARRVEVEWMNRCRLDGTNPSDEAGEELLQVVRQEMDL